MISHFYFSQSILGLHRGYHNRNSHERNKKNYISWVPQSTRMHCDCFKCNMVYTESQYIVFSSEVYLKNVNIIMIALCSLLYISNLQEPTSEFRRRKTSHYAHNIILKFIQRHSNVYTTSFKRYGRWIDVETTLCAHRVAKKIPKYKCISRICFIILSHLCRYPKRIYNCSGTNTALFQRLYNVFNAGTTSYEC